ncbi:MAG: phosphoenolpyruvate hydrolase family protein [Candidatus Poribacteria bacterium]|nr:phosphoenolpyruvate hydrolase family protein [Candidatus Poribacteria bacterium]
MATKYTRQQMIQRFRSQLDQGNALIGAGAGTGISAKFIERGGADFIIIYNSGRFRMAGIASAAGLLAYGNANEIMMDMGEREVLPITKEIPVIAGVNGSDPTREMEPFLRQVGAMNFSGVNNFPTIGAFDGQFRQILEEVGLGYYTEVEMVKIAHELDLFTIPYVYDETQARDMTRAGADAVIAHVGTTTGGSIGAQTAFTHDEAADLTRRILEAARAERESVFVLTHGGRTESPEDVQYVLDKSGADGFVGASTIERLATEPAIQAKTSALKKVTVNR